VPSFVRAVQVTARVGRQRNVPLVRLPPTGNAVAALRYALTTISGSGQLYQPRLRGDELYLEFRDKLTRMHPAKVLEVLRRMPVEADRCDDWLVGLFGAEPLERAAIEPLTEDELTRAEARGGCTGTRSSAQSAAQALDVVPQRGVGDRAVPRAVRAADLRLPTGADLRERGGVERRPGRSGQARGRAGPHRPRDEGRHQRRAAGQPRPRPLRAGAAG
jgi:hypothetical protein